MKSIEKLEEERLNILMNMDNTDNDFGVALDEFQKQAYELSWERTYNDGWISENYTLFEMLEFFLSKNETNKCNYIAFLLNKYYPEFLEEKIQQFINEEQYEKCSILTSYLNIKNIPIF